MIRRIARIVVAYLAASLIAGIMIAITVEVGGSDAGTAGPDIGKAVGVGLVIVSPFVAVLAALPAFVIVPILERRRVRQPGVYVISATLTGLAIVALIGNEPGTIDYVMAGLGGFFAGLVYWAVAGRKAGRDQTISVDHL